VGQRDGHPNFSQRRGQLLRVISHLGGDVPERIAAAFPDAEVVRVHGRGEVDADLHGDVLVTLIPKHVPNVAEVLQAAQGVTWVHVAATGVDSFPLHLVPGGATVTCNRGASAVAISEWVLAQMLAFEKRLPDVWLSEPPAVWNFSDLGTLSGRRLGLIGWGAIAQGVAQRALPFGSEVRALRRRAEPSGMGGVEIVTDLLDLVAWADHLVVAAPATPATRHLIGTEVLAAAKPGLHLVNIARGSLVDQDALSVALDDGTVALASLDVVDPEPLPAGHWLYEHPKVHVTAHVSWNMPGALDDILDPFLANLARFQTGQPLVGEVDRTEGY
jgi:phosphoglycerate dehydrogenase-like enzyme